MTKLASVELNNWHGISDGGDVAEVRPDNASIASFALTRTMDSRTAAPLTTTRDAPTVSTRTDDRRGRRPLRLGVSQVGKSDQIAYYIDDSLRQPDAALPTTRACVASNDSAFPSLTILQNAHPSRALYLSNGFCLRAPPCFCMMSLTTSSIEELAGLGADQIMTSIARNPSPAHELRGQNDAPALNSHLSQRRVEQGLTRGDGVTGDITLNVRTGSPFPANLGVWPQGRSQFRTSWKNPRRKVFKVRWDDFHTPNNER
ncbi:MAG: hypothetical protein ACLVAV_12800 [Clostridium sp.]